jgi:Na+-transporting NADH:ubiquinone oxidoreductase subunit C
MRELKVLAHGETPGLGGRIEEAWFQDQFKGLDVSAGVKVEKEKKGVAGEVDAIAGATRTGNAVMTIINKAIDVLR